VTIMRRLCVVIAFLLLASCATVISKDLMRQAARNPDLGTLLRDPELFRGKLFVLGGIIARTTLTPSGSEIEALYVPVDSLGYTRRASASAMRYLALYPREKGTIDPLVYKRDRRITIAGVFTGIEKGMVDRMEYTFPVFRIEEVHIAEEMRYAPAYPAYPYWDPYWGPYWGPAWRFGWGFGW
jgi:outer membrane lipoprotein